MFSRLLAAMSVILASIVSTASVAEDLENGRSIARTNCAHCHGEDGDARSTSFQPVPMLAGQPAVHLVQEMRNYATGAREDKSKRQAMSKVLGLLKDKDIDDVAAHYAAQKRYWSRSTDFSSWLRLLKKSNGRRLRATIESKPFA